MLYIDPSRFAPLALSGEQQLCSSHPMSEILRLETQLGFGQPTILAGNCQNGPQVVEMLTQRRLSRTQHGCDQGFDGSPQCRLRSLRGVVHAQVSPPVTPAPEQAHQQRPYLLPVIVKVQKQRSQPRTCHTVCLKLIEQSRDGALIQRRVLIGDFNGTSDPT